jgi:hypothetical protein
MNKQQIAKMCNNAKIDVLDLILCDIAYYRAYKNPLNAEQIENLIKENMKIRLIKNETIQTEL